MGNTGQSITLANSIIGVGILAMPFCFQQCGVLLATLILVLMGLVSRLCCHFLLKSAIITRRRNFEFLAFHVFGPLGKLAVEVGIIGFLMGTCIAYFVVVGDLGPQIISKLFNINQSDMLRTSIMVIVSLVCVLPLGLLRNVDSLSNVSAATIGFYFCLVIKVITEATAQLVWGERQWQRLELWRPAGLLQCVPVVSMALFCQTQLFEIFESMPSLSLEKMNKVTKNAINICTAVYFTLGLFGYAAFGSQEISGNVLMSLSPTLASDVIKLGFVMSVAFSFPLIIFPCRASLYSFLYRKAHSSHHDHIINHSIPERVFRGITVCIVCAALAVGVLLPNIELVLGLLGSTVGVLVCVVFPAACFVSVTFKNTNERILAKVVIVLGLIILVLGTYANLQAAENTKEKYDDKHITQDRIDKIVEDFFEKRDKVDGGTDEKPRLVVDSLPNVEVIKLNGENKKDSEVQPPNPIPPDSHSDEKKPAIKVPELIDDSKLKEVFPEVVKDPIEKEAPPKIIQNKFNDAKLSNGVKTVKKPQEKSKEPLKPTSQEKSDIEKQKLMETIKQHGQEQLELMKEQKEILDEIKKTRKELKKDKEVDSIEAKKVAVESIQKIANIAIQSLSGVTDKPLSNVDNVDRVKEPIQKIAQDAVQEIAKKAADAIKEIKDNKHKDEDAKVNKGIENNEVLNKDINIKPDQVPNSIPVIQPIENKIIPNTDVISNNNPQLNDNKNVNKGNLVPNSNQNIIQPKIIMPSESIVEKLLDKKDQRNATVLKEHLHSPDEPQSYKQGEDLQKNVNSETKPLNNENLENVPLPIALREHSNNIDTSHSVHNDNNPELQHKKLENVNNVVLNAARNNFNDIKNGAVDDTHKNNVGLNNVNSDNIVIRQKRDVNSEEESLVKRENNQICENGKDKPVLTKQSEEIFSPNLNLNDIGLPNRLQGMAIHHMRSLKSYGKDETS